MCEPCPRCLASSEVLQVFVFVLLFPSVLHACYGLEYDPSLAVWILFSDFCLVTHVINFHCPWPRGVVRGYLVIPAV